LEKPEGFDDLEDEDHGGGATDWEDYDPWTTGFFHDEPNEQIHNLGPRMMQLLWGWVG
jgi:hypothetical protein